MRQSFQDVAAPQKTTTVVLRRRVDALVLAGFLLAALYLYQGLWLGPGSGPGSRLLADSGQDQRLWEWFFAVAADNVTSGDNPFLSSTLQNHPDGVNLMANTATPALTLPLIPVTLLFGPAASWAVAVTGGLALTGYCWYVLFSRHITRTRTGAIAGAVFCAFAPPMVSHANAHPNFVVLFAIPLIIRQLIRLAHHQQPTRSAVKLGLLTTYQIFLGEEVLLLTATGLAAFGIAYTITRPEEARAAAKPLLTGVGIGAAVCLPLVACPLLWQFAGPQSYSGLLHGPAGNDLSALTTFADRSLGGDVSTSARFSLNRTEENAFFGWPLVILTAALAVVFRRRPAVKALAAVIVTAALLSLGPEIIHDGEPTGIPGPWAVGAKMPLYESVLESRFTMVCVPAIGVLLALAADEVRACTGIQRTVWAVALAQALFPLTPQPLRSAERPPVPAFFTDGLWRDHVRPGRSVVAAPLPDPGNATALTWQIAANLEFPLADGYFLGPFGSEKAGGYGAPSRTTSALLREVAASGDIPAIGPDERAAVRADLNFWRAGAVVLGPHRHRQELKATLDLLLGPGESVGGVHVWTTDDGHAP